MRIEWNGAEKLAKALYQKSQTDFIAVCKAGTTQLRNQSQSQYPCCEKHAVAYRRFSAAQFADGTAVRK